MKQATKTKEEGSDDSRDTGHGDKEDEERGTRNRRKVYENEVEEVAGEEVEEEVQEEIKKANGSVHTGEKNSMPENEGGEEYRCSCRWGMPAQARTNETNSRLCALRE